ncbi:MAG: peptide chain release factor 1 [Clostridia bacterium]|nr:peptide chain release factor 1 [Clostridia bacterium]
MKEQFERIMDRWQELSAAIGEPEVIASQEQYQRLLKERAVLVPQVEAWERYLQLQQHLSEAEEMLRDPELRGMAEEEQKRLTIQLVEAEGELRLLLLPRDPDDDRSVILEIRPSAGGEESALFAADLCRMYEHYAQRRGYRFEPVSISDTELGGLKSAVIAVSGSDAYARFKFESGVHRVQRVPVTEASGRKQTSTCTVAVLPEAEDIDLVIDPKELRIDTYRASGHGGQYINRTDSAVRITHLPTGLVATCQDQKSQLKNREQAMKVLRSRLMEKMRSEADAAYAQRRRLQVGTGDRSERIRTYNFHEGRVTDHRIGLTLYRIDDIMNGDLDELVDALRAAEQAELLRQSGI